MSTGNDYTMVQFGTMEQGQADFQQTYSSLVSEMDTLQSQLQSNLSQWTGAAQSAYHTAQAQWNAAMANMQQTLQQLAAVIGTANDNYTQAEASNTARWQ